MGDCLRLFSNSNLIDGNLDSTVKHMNDVIYSYFRQNYGTVKSANHSNLMISYKDKSIRKLKKEVKNLKAMKADTIEIKFVANLLRKKLQKTDATRLDDGCHSSTVVNYDQYIGTGTYF